MASFYMTNVTRLDLSLHLLRANLITCTSERDSISEALLGEIR